MFDRKLQADVLALQATVKVTKMIGLEFSRYLQSSANNLRLFWRLKMWDFSTKGIVQQTNQLTKSTRAHYLGIKKATKNHIRNENLGYVHTKMDIFEPQTFLHESAFCSHETSEFGHRNGIVLKMHSRAV